MPIRWETTADILAKKTIAALGIADGNGLTGAAAILALPRSPVATQLNRWVEHQRRVLGRTEFKANDVRSQVKRAAFCIAITYTESGGQGDPTSDTAQAIAVMLEKHETRHRLRPDAEAISRKCPPDESSDSTMEEAA